MLTRGTSGANRFWRTNYHWQKFQKITMTLCSKQSLLAFFNKNYIREQFASYLVFFRTKPISFSFYLVFHFCMQYFPLLWVFCTLFHRNRSWIVLIWRQEVMFMDLYHLIVSHYMRTKQALDHNHIFPTYELESVNL